MSTTAIAHNIISQSENEKSPLAEATTTTTTSTTGATDVSSARIKYGFRLVSLIFLSMILSLTIAAKISCYPITTKILKYYHPTYPRYEIEWIGNLYSAISYLLMPIICGCIDITCVNYRLCLLFGGLLQVVGLIASAGIQNPYFLLLTDSFLCGIGSSICLSVIILVMDDCFPPSSSYRIIATSLCQGSVFALFFVSEAYLFAMAHLGWMKFHLALAALFALEITLLTIVLPGFGNVPCLPNDFNRNEDGRIINLSSSSSSSPTAADCPAYMKNPAYPWIQRLLGLTQQQLNHSPTIVPYLLFQFILQLISNGVFIFLLMDVYNIFGFTSLSIVAFKHSRVAAYLFSIGQTLFYVGAGAMGQKCRGFLLHIYCLALLLLFILFIMWQIFLNSFFWGQLPMTYNCTAFLVGSCLGILNTYSFAASEEATRIPARRIFPFTRMVTGTAFVIGAVTYKSINNKPNHLFMALFALFCFINIFCLCYTISELYRTRFRQFNNGQNHPCWTQGKSKNSSINRNYGSMTRNGEQQQQESE